ncbi:fatty acid binding protein [Holotrichia oblita]|uniref:Fatty acid binding protein n=1 Tax=Holotrichia oblita TaxID=644536 RepID=A0ACB9SXC5_HOLOL|nr:fatty acid binding protein [Holotrichia oblita]
MNEKDGSEEKDVDSEEEDYEIYFMKLIESFLDKKYKLVASENFNEVMKVLGVGVDARRQGLEVCPEICLSKDGDYYVLLSTCSFLPGVEFDYITPDDRKVRSTITITGNVLTEVQVDENGKVTTIERIFTDSDVTVVCKVDDVDCTRVYRIQHEE